MNFDTPLFFVLSLAACVSGVLHIYFEYHSARFVYIFKPLTMLCIIALAVMVPAATPNNYRLLLITGLVFSLAGDIFLMLPSERFVHGLASFLVAHLFYIAAFKFTASYDVSLYLFLPYFAVSTCIFMILRPHLGNLMLPVAVYILIISLMAWLGCERWLAGLGIYTCIGASLFMISDAVLAFNKFKLPFRSARFFVMTTYFLAQWFIAVSITGM